MMMNGPNIQLMTNIRWNSLHLLFGKSQSLDILFWFYLFHCLFFGICRSQLKEHTNIDCRIIYDSEAAYIMETIDLVLVGAEAVVKNGGIINKVYLHNSE